ncbi:hypothetical protein CEP52_004233 [Fusarium oligoseptatum]|uniref:RNA helicase n=1 Tax=Fusarium oligoseptatum TaxID=2604345 RepID=A0A428U4K1_9HYPO|nr:hypothetical protein CEP52_004233 [Fusarium oligoseptatum]
MNPDCPRGYIDETSTITDKGRQSARLPVDPVWYNAMVEARTLGCLSEMLSIVALVTAQSQHSIFLRPLAYRDAPDAAFQEYACPKSDHITQLQAFHQYVQAKKAGREDLYYHNHFLDLHVLEETLRLRTHITATVQTLFGPVTGMDFEDKQYTEKICKALARSLFCNTAFRDPGSRAAKGNVPIIENKEDLYRTAHRNHHAALHPGSALIGIKHEWVVYDKFMPLRIEADLAYFQDEMLSRKRSEVLRQPYVKRSLDQAREKDLPYFQDEKLARKRNGSSTTPRKSKPRRRRQPLTSTCQGTWATPKSPIIMHQSPDLEAESTDDWSDETDADEHARYDPNKRSNKYPKKKRKRDEDLSNEERPKKLAKRKKSRLCSASAYLYMVLADGGPAFKRRDDSGQAASGRSVKYHDGLTAEGVFIEALHWHDAYERGRFTEYNKNVMIALARRRVRNWAESDPEGMAAIGRRRSDDAARFETVCSKTQMSTRQRDILVVMSENASILSSLEVMWLWKDECGQATPKGCVNFHRGLVM